MLLSTQSPGVPPASVAAIDPVQRRHEVRPDEIGDEEASRGEGDEGRGHRRDGAPEDEAGEHAEREREERVRRHDDSLDVEAARADPPLERVEGAAPPHDDGLAAPAATTVAAASSAVFESSQRRRRDALRPREPVGAELELAGEQRRADEQRRRAAGSTARKRVAVTSPPNSPSKCGDDDVAARFAPPAEGRPRASRGRTPPDRQMRPNAAAASATSRPSAPSELRPVLPPRHPCHRSGTLSGGSRRRQPLGRHVGEQELLEADGLDRPRRIDDRPVGDGEQRQLAAAVPLADDLAHAADRAERPPRAGQEPVRLEQLLDVALQADAAAGQQHDVVADALDVGDDVRRDDHGRPELRDAVHQ